MSDGEDGRDEGMALVLENTPEEWKRAYWALCVAWFVAQPVGSVFNGEALRLNAEAQGLEDPHHQNAWSAMAGSYLRSALKAGLIERHSLSKATSAQAHARNYPSYRKTR